MKNGKDLWTRRRVLSAFALAFPLGLAFCGPSAPVTVAPGAEHCEHCHMTIHDMRFHAQAVNQHGKIRHFDSIECALAYQKENTESVTALYAANFLHQGTYLTLLGAGEPAVIIQSSKIKSPMSGGLAAVRGSDAEQILVKFGGALKTPKEIQDSGAASGTGRPL